jgi:hypothetical protein
MKVQELLKKKTPEDQMADRVDPTKRWNLTRFGMFRRFLLHVTQRYQQINMVSYKLYKLRAFIKSISHFLSSQVRAWLRNTGWTRRNEDIPAEA